jgi:hypothetical protein
VRRIAIGRRRARHACGGAARALAGGVLARHAGRGRWWTAGARARVEGWALAVEPRIKCLTLKAGEKEWSRRLSVRAGARRASSR